jgi:DNA polymerase-3 subunit alpha
MGVRGIGRNVADEIIKEREKNGPYKSLHDFVERVDYSIWNRKTLEALIKGGAFDSTGYTRRQLMHFVDETSLLDDVSKRQKDINSGQVSMFDMFADVADSGFEEVIPDPDGIEWEKSELLRNEKEILGIYVSEHPMEPYSEMISRMTKYTMGYLSEFTRNIKSATFVGMISGIVKRQTKRGTNMATFQLEDTTGRVYNI